MTLCIPFFFLLVDSVFLSALAAFSGLVTTGAMVPPLLPVVASVTPEAAGTAAEGAAAGGAASGLIGLSLAAAGCSVIVGGADGLSPFGAGSAAGEVEGEVAASPPAPLGASMISTPKLFPAGADDESDATGTASTGAPESARSALPFPLTAGRIAKVNDGPVAPGFRTSVAEIASSGGFKLGWPVWAALETSGMDFTINIGSLTKAC